MYADDSKIGYFFNSETLRVAVNTIIINNKFLKALKSLFKENLLPLNLNKFKVLLCYSMGCYFEEDQTLL